MAETRVPIQKRSIETKNKIMEKGLELVFEKGYPNVTTKDIAEYAGVSIGNIYQYYTDKKDIIEHALKNYYIRRYDYLEELFNNSMDVNSMIVIVIDAYFNHVCNHIDIYRQLFILMHTEEDFAKIFTEADLELQRRLIRFLENINVHYDDIEHKLHYIYSLLTGITNDIIIYPMNKEYYLKMRKVTARIIKQILEDK